MKVININYKTICPICGCEKYGLVAFTDGYPSSKCIVRCSDCGEAYVSGESSTIIELFQDVIDGKDSQVESYSIEER